MKRTVLGRHVHHHWNELEDRLLTRAINLLRWRAWVGVTQKDLAEQLGVSSATISSSENEVLEIGRGTEAAFAKFYGVTVDELYLPDSEPWVPRTDSKKRYTWLNAAQQKRLASVKGHFVPGSATPAWRLKTLREKQA